MFQDRQSRNEHVVGALNNGNFLMKDQRSGSWWSQLDGCAIAGPCRGTKLETLPTVTTTWRRFKALYPEGRVIVPDPKKTGYDYGAPAGGKRYAGYMQSDRLAGVRWSDTRGLRPKVKCVGVREHGAAKAWPYAELEKTPMPLNDAVGDVNVVVVYERKEDCAWVYERGDLTFTQPESRAPAGAVMRDAESGSHFDARGRAIDGALAGTELKRPQTLEVLWFAWSLFHPNTELHRA